MPEPIAVVGSGCRFPGKATTPSKLWELLKQPRDVQSQVPSNRFNTALYHHQDGTKHGRTNAQHAYLIQEDIRAFDAGFFNISPQEAEVIDPQHRLLLETVYESLESAGIKVENLQGSDTAVYVGLMFHDYQDLVNYDHEAIPTYAATGTAGSILSNRVSYFFDWHGPSMTIDTACSSSLVALHHAVQQLRSGSSRVAIAAGANLILSPIPFIVESKMNMLSPNGRSRMWDQAADGYARGEGVASVVLKTLSQALRDGDPIECIIRESGVNQDGKTAGITMPSHIAQEKLIRDTYSRAGLDLSLAQSRCQYFEAHGTGTVAGDSNEAEAIASAFFGNKPRPESEDPLFVGSIKTVIGHTEGTAGIAGLIKTSLAVQHGIIPPNMLFEKLSSRVAPFYRDLRIVKEPQAWPSLPAGVPRRARFGGTNAHVIIESYEKSAQEGEEKEEEEVVGKVVGDSSKCALPFVLSASSESSLMSTMENLLQFLRNNPNIQPMDLAWTLWQKRSVLSVRHSFAAQTISAVSESLANEIALLQSKSVLPIKTDVRHKPRILGVFTGQGAQYPAMGRSLLVSIPYAREIVERLDESLRTLPIEYRPDWTLREQLMLEGDASNVKNAAFSQPLCCAVQIVLVQLLRAAGITFKAVVGHSSGEIACAFAAGLLSESQAIRTAHLRGLMSKYAASQSGEEGGMLAAGCSSEDAQNLCDLEIFEDRICVAASNGPDSVTLSGDLDAIKEAQTILDDEGKFTRLLKVDKAYHSHHMQPCASPYVEALRACGCADGVPLESSTIWISSVFEGKKMSASDLTPEYWKHNLVNPVLFSQALGALLVEHSLMDVAIEVGSHPALKGPSLSVIEGSVGLQLPYTGCMQRGTNDIDTFANALGFIWERFGPDSIDIDGFVKSLPQAMPKNLAPALPRYSWDHSRSYWTESRATRSFLRNESGPPHPLLGILSPSSTPSTFEWHNFLEPQDIEWLDGHQLQGQTVFPGAGYAIMALEATMHLAASMGDLQVRLLEIQHLKIEKAITFDDDNSLVEMNMTLDVDSTPRDAEAMTVHFRLSSCLARENSLTQSATGQIIVTFGSGSPDALPSSRDEPPHMSSVSTDLFYKELAAVGYHYSKDFRGLRELKRAESQACGTMLLPKFKEGKYGLLLHPATLDVAFQTLIGASTAPGDGRLRSLLVPTSIGRITLNPWLCARVYGAHDSLNFNSIAVASKGNLISGDIEVFEPGTRSTILQVEGISTKPARAPSSADDHQMFSNWVWGKMEPDRLLNNEKYRATEEERTVAADMERIVYFYIKTCLGKMSDPKNYAQLLPHYQTQVDWFRGIISNVNEGRHLWYQEHWEQDNCNDILKLCELHSYHPHIRLIQRVGEHLDDIFSEKRNAFDVMDHDGLLTEFYGDVLGFGPAYYYFQEHIAQVTHRYPSMDILEIGAGTGGATKYVLGTEQLCFNSYTFTDISPSFFEKASRIFEQHEDRMEFRTLDVRRDPVEQGFKPHSFDMVIASNVLHATPNLEETLANARTLLKPGGELVVIEITHREHSRIGFIFGLFADWWAGRHEGRISEPFVSIDHWDEIARKVGFPGVSCRTVDPDSDIHPTSVWCTRNVDDEISTLIEPLSAPLRVPESYSPIAVIGGSSPKTANILEKVRAFLPHRRFIVTTHLQDFKLLEPYSKLTFLLLSEMDEPVFSLMTANKFEALQRMFECAGSLLWMTENAWIEHPYQAMGIGFVRTMRLERTDTHIQVLDVDKTEDLDAKLVAEQLLRLEVGPDWSENRILWLNEPEIYVKDNKILIPRLKPDRAKNERLNSARRQIHADLDPAERPIGLIRTHDTPHLEAIEDHDPNRDPDSSSCSVIVHHALVHAIRIGDIGYFHIILGVDETTSTPVVALAQVNQSKILLPSTQVIHWPAQERPDTCSLLQITADLIAKLVVSDVKGKSILIFQPPEFCTNAIIGRAKASGVSVKFVSTHPSPPEFTNFWLQVHEKETHRLLAKKLPSSVSAFCDFSVVPSAENLASRLITCLPQTCRVYRREYFAQEKAKTTLTGQLGNAMEHLELIVRTCKDLNTAVVGQEIPVSDLVASSHHPDISTVIDWQGQNSLSARVQPIDSGELFLRDKTYLLVGLTGDLGRSICRWMIEHGARHVVLSSRNPKVEQRWIEEMGDLGGNVLIVPMDVSDETSLDTGLRMIEQNSMPHIGGVAFGPLVLKDVLFENMEIAQMEAVLKPKVSGLRLLHERLSRCDLDFFVMFSSFVMVCGNPGQSAYGAANAYTHAVAQQRRARGQAGSTIDMGAIWGVGYIVRQGREEEYDVISFKFDKVSEQELHALFAEAVVRGRPGTQEDVEVMTGMRFIDPSNRDVIPHYYDPRLAYFRLPEGRRETGAGGTSLMSVKERLLNVTSMDEVRQIITDGLAERIRTALALSVDNGIQVSVPLIDQGVDSLSAVTIGTWFSKNLDLDLPLLKILGGASVLELVEEAVDRIHPDAIPLMHKESVAYPTIIATSENDSRVDTPIGSTPPFTGTATPMTERSSSPTGRESLPVLDEGKQNRIVPMSLSQEHCWELHKSIDDPSKLNSTIGMYMKGYLDLGRLSDTFSTALHRHEAFRTCFFETEHTPSRSVQAIMETPHTKFEAVQVKDRIAAEQGFKELACQKYNLAKGDTLRIVDLYWAADEHLLIIAYHQMACDGWSYERLFLEVSQLYSGAKLPPPTGQYSDFATRQRSEYSKGRMDKDIAYWLSLHKDFTAVLPTLSLPEAQKRTAPTWEQHTLTTRLSPIIANRIKEQSHKYKATPFHFYLAAYHALLARLTSSAQADIAIGVADANRSDRMEDLSTMGFFYNLLPLRFKYDTKDSFDKILVATKAHQRDALLHSRVPYSVILDRLGVIGETEHAPLFQAMFDYKQGQAESGNIGEALIVDVLAERLRMPYDITLDISDDPTKAPLLTFKLQKCLYGEGDVKVVMDCFVSLLSSVSTDVTMGISDVNLGLNL